MIFAEANHMTTSTEKERDWQLPLTNLSLSIYVCNIYNPGANTGNVDLFLSLCAGEYTFIFLKLSSYAFLTDENLLCEF